VAHDDGPTQSESTIEIHEGLGEGIHAVGKPARRWLFAIAKTWKVRTDHPVLVRKKCSQLAKGASIDEKAMKAQHDGRLFRSLFINPEADTTSNDVSVGALHVGRGVIAWERP
jgi:hypothetical protein